MLVKQNFTKVDGGVDCKGVLSLMYYPMIIILFALVVTLFDSTLYLFLKVSPGDYRHFVATYLHQFLPKRELARIIEHFSIQGLVVVIEKSVKNLLQVMIANLVFSHFIPVWSKKSPTSGTVWQRNTSKILRVRPG